MKDEVRAKQRLLPSFILPPSSFRIRPPSRSGFRLLLEAEANGCLYASVARGDVAAAAEAADGEERLPEVGRAEVADGVREVRVVEHVDEEEREGHRVALLLSAAAANAAAEAGPLEDGYA